MSEKSDEGVEESKDFPIPLPVVIAGVVVAANPLLAVLIFAGWVAFRYARVPAATFAMLAVPAGVVAFLFGGAAPSRWLDMLSTGLTIGRGLFSSGEPDVASSSVAAVILETSPLVVFCALLGSAALAWWSWRRRPEWETRQLRSSLWQWHKRRRVERDIAMDRGGPRDGCTVGVDVSTGRRVVLTDSELAAPRLVVGAPGSGKTQTLMVSAREAARRGIAVIAIDLKGGLDVAEDLALLAQRYGRTFRHWSIQDSSRDYSGPASWPSHYDPVGRGDPSRRKDLLIASQQWDVEYYRQLIASYLQLLFRIVEVQPDSLDPHLRGCGTLPLLASLLTPEALRDHAHSIPLQAPQRDALIAEAEAVTSFGREERSALSGMYGRVQQLATSTAGPWLTSSRDQERNIDLGAVIHSGDIVCFSLDTSTYNETARLVGGLIIQDLKTICAEARLNPSANPTHVYIDEFAELDTHNIIGLINKSRDAKLAVTLATQALGDLRRADHGFADQVLGNAGTFAIHRANTHADAETLAGLTGHKVSYRRSHSADGQQSRVDEVEAFNVSPDVIQSLPVGQCILVTKSPRHQVRQVQVVMDRVSEVTPGSQVRADAPTPPPLGSRGGVPGDRGGEAHLGGVEPFGVREGSFAPGLPVDGEASPPLGLSVDFTHPEMGAAGTHSPQANEQPAVDDLVLLPPPPPVEAVVPAEEETSSGRPGISKEDLGFAIDSLLSGKSLTQVLLDHDSRPGEPKPPSGGSSAGP